MFVFSFIILFKISEHPSTKVFRKRFGVSLSELCEQHSITRCTSCGLSALSFKNRASPQSSIWQHLLHKCHCLVGHCHMFKINFTKPSLSNLDLKWQILIWSYLKDNTFPEITFTLPYILWFGSPKLWFKILFMILSDISATKCHLKK